jgi:hypothetical protein
MLTMAMCAIGPPSIRRDGSSRLRGAAQHAGQLRADLDLSVAVELLVGPLYHRWLLRTAPLTEAYADAVTDLALRALAP